jgi:LPS O-antigen subunit length determinant protein (WzzB/FepE family)
MVAKSAQMRVRESENNSRQPRDLLINSHSDNLKKSQLTHSQGILKKGDIDNESDDLRTSASQNRATKH